MFIDFKFFRNNVSIIEVALALGYEKNRVKSTKSELEFRHNDFPNIVINNPNNPSRQMYFTRGVDKDRGDVAKFVEFRLNRFPVSYSTKLEGIDKVLSSFAGIPFDLNKWLKDNKVHSDVKQKSSFNKEDFNIYTPKLNELSYLTKERGLSEDTLNKFLPFIKIAQTLNYKYNYRNIGFPYENPGEKKLAGFELVNYNFKQMAPGTDKSNAVWNAELQPKGISAKNVFFAESAIDAMSFYQLYRKKFNFDESVFVSTGGQLSKNQVLNVLKEHPSARTFTIFDNDVAGNLFAIRLAAFKSNIELTVSKNKKDDFAEFKLPDKSFTLPSDKINLENFKKASGLRPEVRALKADGKDYNEMLTNILKKNETNEHLTSKIRR